MRRGKALWLVLGLVGILAAAPGVRAAEFSSALEAELERAGAKDLVSAIVILESPIDIRALDDQLHIRQASKAQRNKEVLEALQYNAAQTQPAFRGELEAGMAMGEVTGYTAYWIENLFVIQATKDFLESLRDRGDLTYVTENFRTSVIEPIITPEKEPSTPPITTLTLPPGIRAVGAYRVATELGITGQGVLVANCDTGVDGNHPALASRWRGNFAPAAECWRDALGSAPNFPADGNGHGTHVMGTITGRAIVGADTQWVGCAPHARWIATNSINQGVGAPFDNDIIADYQWFANPDGNINTTEDVPDVIQNSWRVNGNFSGYLTCDDRWNTVILNCEAAGPVITWSAGNEGPSSSTMGTPPNYEFNAYQIFSVGAVDASAYPSTPYPIASFSSRGPTPCPPNPNAIKPEIVAPGVNVYSSVPGGGYNGSYSGTSMAGPHVAGCVALMRQACPDCDPQTIKAAIMNTAIDTGYPPNGEDNTFGAGMIDCYQAVLSVSSLGHLVGVVRDAANNPIAGATVRNPNGLQSTLTNAQGQYDLPLSDGTYSIQYSKFGYVTQQVNGLVIVEGQNTTQNVNLVLAPTGQVSGTVTSCGGGPAVGATVTILNTPIPPATTNASGVYTIVNVPQGTYDMRAQGAGCGPHTVNGVVIGANTIRNFSLPNDPIYSCSAADEAGYVACEDGDANGPTYAWFEISPADGGPGTATNVSGDDVTGSVALPFTFRHYGQNYTTAYFSSNGAITFNSANSSYSNQSIPNAGMGPAIFPFWDDLRSDNGGDISYYYHASENAMIIEWNNVPHFSSLTSRETFQVWLYNFATNPAPNGNSQIRIQYQEVADASSNTVGVQSGTVGNSYAYNNTLDPNAQGLANGRVICFGGCQAAVVGTLAGTITNCTGGPAAGATVSFPGSFYPDATTNAQGQYSVNVVPGTYSVRATSAACCPVQSNGHVVNANQTTTVNLTLAMPADIAITPDTVRASAPLGGTDTELLHICNTGPCDLTWSVAFNQLTPTGAATFFQEARVLSIGPDEGIGKVMLEDNERGPNQLDAQGGPDLFGYTWIDSDEPGGPAYQWVECVNVGQNTGLTGDDQTVSLALPFTFSYYGNDYTSVWVSSNGNLQFGATASGAWTNTALPSASAPANIVAVFWDDLYLPSGGSVWYLSDPANQRFIVQWDTIPHISGATNRYTFEAILYANGRIVTQYQRLDGFVNSCTIGQQNLARNDGLQVVFNAAYAHPELAIRTQSTPPWMEFSGTTSGTLSQGQCFDVTMNFMAGDLPAGTYEGVVATTNSDPDENPTSTPIRFTVGVLETPDSLTVSYNRTTNQLIFRWTPSAGATQYRLLSAADPTGPFATLVATTAATQATVPFPAVGSKLFYVVVAESSNGATSLPGPARQALVDPR